MKTRKIAFVFAGVFLPACLFGQLSFETTEVRIDVELGAGEVRHAFEFENTGDYTVEITAVGSSCGCTTADLDKRVYEPGERGDITGIFAVGNRVGVRANTITVRTDDPEQPRHVLRMTMDIPREVTLSPRVLSWRLEEGPVTRTVEAAFHPDVPYKVEGVESESENFEVALIEDEENEGTYRLEVTPRNMDGPERAMIYFRTSPEPSDPRTLAVYAYVR